MKRVSLPTLWALGYGALLAAGCLPLLAQPTPSASAPTPVATAGYAVLVFSKTAGYRHAAIPDGIAAIRALGAQHGFRVDASEDASVFSDQSLAAYQVVVFLCTSGDILDEQQQAAFERFIRAGGGFVGVHSASDTEYDWPWYGALVGSYFADHPAIQPGRVRVADPAHPTTQGLPDPWQRTDEWYNFRSQPGPEVAVLLQLDETSYNGGTMGQNHPIAWCQQYDGGRAWYTGMGHTPESYAEEPFRLHLAQGIRWAAGDRSVAQTVLPVVAR